MKELTIIMPFLNESNEPLKTIETIYSTIPSRYLSKIDIVAIEDASIPFFKTNLSSFPSVISIKNKHRLGVDGCRQLGVNMSKTDNIMIIDGHMRFKNDNWFEKILDYLKREPETLWCTTCLVLGYGNMDIYRATDKYYGASIIFENGESKTERPSSEILEPKWIEKKEGVDYDIPVILGANYFFTKKWFNYIGGLNGLKMWGTSESFLSLKSWMAGGKCKIATDIEIGHKFRDSAPYSTNIWCIIYNKIYLCKTILPLDLSDKLLQKLNNDGNFVKAMREIEKNKEAIGQDKIYYDNVLTNSIDDFCKRFNIVLPLS
jgi:glycosyltransferase involved in cell wall biosynthesis